MSQLTVNLTELGENIESGLVTAVLAQAGESVTEGDTLIEIETDKAVLPFPSPSNGTIKEILIEEGTEIKVGDKIALLEGGDGGDTAQPKAEPKVESKGEPAAAEQAKLSPPPTTSQSSPPPAQTTTPTVATVATTTSPPPAAAQPAAAQPAPAPTQTTSSTTNTSIIAASPGTRKLARELGVSLAQVRGSGRESRITMDDLKAHVKSSLQHAASTGAAAPAPHAAPLPNFSEFGEVKVEKMSRLRETIARNMQTSWSTIPHVHHNCRADLTVISRWQARYHKAFKDQGSTLSVTPILIKAMGQCLKKFPVFNSSLDIATHELHLKSYVNIGVAVDTEAGLIVPVIHNVDTKTVFEIGRELRELAGKTRERKIGLADLKGGCMTLSNLGGIGGEHFTPIVNPPEVAILAAARTQNELRLIDGVPQEVPLLPMTLGYDHRVIDGAVAARFLVALKDLVETPEALLMGIDLA